MEAGAKAITDYGITVIAVVVLALSVGFFIRDLIRQRDAWRALAESAVTAFDRLSDQLGVDPHVRPERPKK